LNDVILERSAHMLTWCGVQVKYGVLVSNQLVIKEMSDQSFHPGMKMTQNLSNPCPVGSSDALSPLMAMMPT